MTQMFTTAAVPEPRCSEDEIKPMLSAVERYKEIVAQAAEAHGDMRAQDAKRSAELIERLARSQNQMAEVIDGEQIVRLAAERHWAATIKLLWNENWMEMKKRPEPDMSVPVRPQSECTAAMERAFLALEESLQKRGLLKRKS